MTLWSPEIQEFVALREHQEFVALRDQADRGLAGREKSAVPAGTSRAASARGLAPVGLVELKNVTKSYGSRQVLKGIDLKIRAGECLAVVGRSGGGKSTLLRLISGLEAPTSGEIRFDGERVTGLRPEARVMFQEARLLPWLRVLENIGVARGEGWRERAQEVLGEVGLGDRGRDWPRVLSGGQKQRVALARALASQPGFLLLDEPFGALDALTRGEMHQLLDGLRRRRNLGAVLITHDSHEAIALGDRVLALREGRISLNLPITAEDRRHRAPEIAEKLLAAI